MELSHLGLREQAIHTSSILGFRSLFAGMVSVAIAVFVSAYSMAYEFPGFTRSTLGLIIGNSIFWFCSFKLGWAISVFLGLGFFTVKAFMLNWGAVGIWVFLLAYSIPFVLLLNKGFSKCPSVAA